MKHILKDSRGAAGWVLIALILAFAVAVGVMVSVFESDKTREREKTVSWVITQVTADKGMVPNVETEIVRDYGENVLIAARYTVEGLETPVSGSYLFNVSDSTFQLYDVSEEYPYDYDYASSAHHFAAGWGIALAENAAESAE